MKNIILNHLTYHGLLKKKRTLILTVFSIIGAFFFVAATNETEKEIIMKTPQETGIKAVIFDLGDVLFTTSKSTHIKTIVPTLLYNPMLVYYLLTQINAKDSFFEFLETISAESQEPIYNKGKKLPLLLNDWMSGIKTPNEMKLIIEERVNNSTYPTSVQNLFIAISDLMFTPEKLAECQEIVIPMTNIVKKFKDSGYQVYVLSNWDEHSFEIIKTKHTQLFDLFDKIFISGKEKLSKPNAEFYKKVLENSSLNPSECLFIDDELYNIQAAQNLGFNTILHADHMSTIQQLMDKNFLTICKNN